MDQVLERLERLSLGPAARVGVAASAGLDSTVLLEAAATLAARRGTPLWVLHVDHGLRGSESDADRRFVEALAAARDLACRVVRLGLDPAAPGSLEARARAARYRAFAELSRALRLSHLLLAHHRDDQVESVLLRVLRGSGPRGLAGMPEARPLAPGHPTLLVRPLLDLSRDALLRAARTRGLAWREDASNADATHRRNDVRHRLLPRLRTADPDVDAHLLALGRRARAVHEALRALARTRTDAVLRWRAPHLDLLDAASLAALPPDLRATLLQELAAERESAFDHTDLDAVAALLRPGAEAAARTLSGARQATRAGPWLCLHRPPAPVLPRPLPRAGAEPLPRGGRLVVRPLRGAEAVAAALGAARRDPLRAVLAPGDGRTLSVRYPEAGDRLRPLGAPGRKAVAELLAARGTPRPLRPCHPLVEDADGPLWVPPVPPAERARVAPGAVGAVELRWEAGPPGDRRP